MKRISLIGLLASLFFVACNDGADHSSDKATDSTATVHDTARAMSVRLDNIDIPADSTTMKCVVAYNENDSAAKPIVLILPEWWGVTEFTRSKAKQIAGLGYLAVVVDIYGGGKVADDPKTAGSYAGPFYTNQKLATSRIVAALNKA